MAAAPAAGAALLQDPDFPQLSGARVVRIAVHPELAGTGYGTRILQQLARYYQGEVASLEESDSEEDQEAGGAGRKQQQKQQQKANGSGAAGGEASLLLTETVQPRSGLPPLLVALADRYVCVGAGGEGERRAPSLTGVFCCFPADITPFRFSCRVCSGVPSASTTWACPLASPSSCTTFGTAPGSAPCTCARARARPRGSTPRCCCGRWCTPRWRARPGWTPL